MKKKLTLGKNERLKSQKQTERLFSEGKRFAITPFRIYYSISKTETASLQFGAGVSKKNFRKAVDRNRIKRLMREAYRLQKTALENGVAEHPCRMTLFSLYTGKDLPEYREVYDKTGKFVAKLCAIIRQPL